MKFKNKIVDDLNLKAKLLSYKIKDEKIVFTNGCFDVLHIGHITLLAKAKTFGNKLIVGLNTDESVKKLKGKSRPINKQNDRALLLAALSFVDLVIFFNDDTPKKLIEIIKPNFLVKGGDYKKSEIVGANFVEENGGKVEIISLVENYSTTNLIGKMTGK